GAQAFVLGFSSFGTFKCAPASGLCRLRHLYEVTVLQRTVVVVAAENGRPQAGVLGVGGPQFKNHLRDPRMISVPPIPKPSFAELKIGFVLPLGPKASREAFRT